MSRHYIAAIGFVKLITLDGVSPYLTVTASGRIEFPRVRHAEVTAVAKVLLLR